MRTWRSLAAVVGFVLVGVPFLARAGSPPPVRVVLFTHIEDNTPAGTLGSAACRQNYIMLRARLIDVAALMQSRAVPWSLQPDWKMLRAALLYEDSLLMQSTNGKNLFRYLREDRGALIDPHSHESGGYNYTDVAHLLDSLGVGGSTVIGGHVWDPALPQFQEWDRYRVPVPGVRYPAALWRGDILMGSGTPGHVNDPVVSGVWRPRDRDHYFEDDPAGNIAAIGQFRGTIEGIAELAGLYTSGAISPENLLTSSHHVSPSTIMRPDGLTAIEDSVITPILALQASGRAVPTDFTSLVASWRTEFGARGFIYDAEASTGVAPVSEPLLGAGGLEGCDPNPFRTATRVRFQLDQPCRVRLEVFDLRGRKVATIADRVEGPGEQTRSWSASGLAPGVYVLRMETSPTRDTRPGRTRCAYLKMLRVP